MKTCLMKVNMGLMRLALSMNEGAARFLRISALNRALAMRESIIALCMFAAMETSDSASARADDSQTVDMPAEVLRDKIRGGLLGQMLGNLNGLKHENKYIAEPGNVEAYTPALPEGARTDDDTDFEWVYIVAMQNENRVCLAPERIVQLWKQRINRNIWCSNRFARHLMDLGIEPPLTGRLVLNPWAEFNISGQFLCETFGLLGPAMPQTASRIGLNYTRVAIDYEPAQTTQLFCTMIATAFTSDDIERILDAGLAAVVPESRVHQVVTDVRRWHGQHPDDWRTTRRLLKEKYTQAGGGMRDMNGYELNTGATIAALLYGRGDFAKTLTTAFNFGWDADNTAATAGTIVGTVKGYRWMLSQGWKIVDRYENTTRENMPNDETITSFADRLIDLAERVIVEQGGERRIVDGQPVYRIVGEKPANVYPLPNAEEQIRQMKAEMGRAIEAGILQGETDQQRARAAYLAICLDMAPTLKRKHPEPWAQAVTSLTGYWKVLQNIYYNPETPLGVTLRAKATAAGLKKPDGQKPVW